MVNKGHNQQMPDGTPKPADIPKVCRRNIKRRLETQKTSKAAVDNVIIAEELEIVRESLQKLDDSLLAPMVLRYFCGLNSNEVGETLALNPSTVRSRLREARMILAKGLLERGLEP